MQQCCRLEKWLALKTSGLTQKDKRGALKNKPQYLFFSPHVESVSRWFGRDFGLLTVSFAQEEHLATSGLDRLLHADSFREHCARFDSCKVDKHFSFLSWCTGNGFSLCSAMAQYRDFFFLLVPKYKSITHTTFFLHIGLFDLHQEEPRFLCSSQQLEITILKI